MAKSTVLPEPSPTRNEQKPLWDLVIADMHERSDFGTRKYGTPLQAFNGRNAAVDAYQESLDQTVYLRQMVEEWTKMQKIVEAAKHYVETGDDTELGALFPVPTSDQLAERLYHGFCPKCGEQGVIFKTGIFGDARSFECKCGAQGSISMDKLDFFGGDVRQILRALIDDYLQEEARWKVGTIHGA